MSSPKSRSSVADKKRFEDMLLPRPVNLSPRECVDRLILHKDDLRRPHSLREPVGPVARRRHSHQLV